MKQRFEVWFPALMIAISVVLCVVAIAHRSWVNLATFALVGITFGMHLHRASNRSHE